MYSLSAYGKMIDDTVRMDAYIRALRYSIKPGSVVVDIGTGTGIFALLACQLGANRVYAIEPNHVIHMARKIAEANGYGNQIEFIQDISTRVSLDERANVIVSDLRDVLPLFRHHIPCIADARQRLLASNGILIPRKDVLLAAVVEAPELYRRFSSPWNDVPYGLDLQTARHYSVQTWSKGRVTPEQLMVKPQSWISLDYGTVEDPDLKGSMTWIVERTATAHGFILWFDTTLVEGVGFSNAPGTPDLIYGQAFFPWLEPVDLESGDHITVSLMADLVDEDYVWRWNTHIFERYDSNRIKAQFSQSTFFSLPESLTTLRKQETSYHPKLHMNGLIDQYIMTLMDGKRSLGDIAHMVTERFEGYFKCNRDALKRVCDLSRKYT